MLEEGGGGDCKLDVDACDGAVGRVLEDDVCNVGSGGRVDRELGRNDKGDGLVCRDRTSREGAQAGRQLGDRDARQRKVHNGLPSHHLLGHRLALESHRHVGPQDRRVWAQHHAGNIKLVCRRVLTLCPTHPTLSVQAQEERRREEKRGGGRGRRGRRTREGQELGCFGLCIPRLPLPV